MPLLDLSLQPTASKSGWQRHRTWQRLPLVGLADQDDRTPAPSGHALWHVGSFDQAATARSRCAADCISSSEASVRASIDGSAARARASGGRRRRQDCSRAREDFYLPCFLCTFPLNRHAQSAAQSNNALEEFTATFKILMIPSTNTRSILSLSKGSCVKYPSDE